MFQNSNLFSLKEAIAVISLVSQQLEQRGSELDGEQLKALGKILSVAHYRLTDSEEGECSGSGAECFEVP